MRVYNFWVIVKSSSASNDRLLADLCSKISHRVRLSATNPAPELFEIEAASPEADEPENQTYEIRMRLQGPYEVRSFLSDFGVDEKRIAFAIEELSRSRRVRLGNQVQQSRAA